MKWWLVAVFSLLAVGRFYFKVKTHSLFDSYRGEESWVLVMYRVVLGMVQGGVMVLYLFDMAPSWMTLFLGEVVALMGKLITILAIGLIFWAHAALGENFSPSVGKAYRLVKEGPYRWIRHPIYLGYIVLFVGVYLVSGWWVFSLIGEMILFSLVVWRLPLEEQFLHELFGEEYREYERTVPRFFPRLM